MVRQFCKSGLGEMTVLLGMILLQSCATFTSAPVSSRGRTFAGLVANGSCAQLFEAEVESPEKTKSPARSNKFVRPNALKEIETSDSNYLFSIDALLRLWESGFRKSKRMIEIWLRGPDYAALGELHGTLIDSIRSLSMDLLDKNQMGFEIHLGQRNYMDDRNITHERVFQIIPGARFLLENLPEAYRDLFSHFLEEFAKVYSDPAKSVPPEILARVCAISHELMARSVLIAISPEGGTAQVDNLFVEKLPKRSMPTTFGRLESGPPGFTLPERFAIEGGSILVSSKGLQEPLPTEVLHSFPIPRESGEELVEISRLFSNGEDQKFEIATENYEYAAAVIAANYPGAKIVGEIHDAAHLALFKSLGFEPIQTFNRWDGKTTYRVKVEPEVFLGALRERRHRLQAKSITREKSRVAIPNTMANDADKMGIDPNYREFHWFSGKPVFGSPLAEDQAPAFVFGRLKAYGNFKPLMAIVLNAEGSKADKVTLLKAMLDSLIGSPDNFSPRESDAKYMAPYDRIFTEFCENLPRFWKKGDVIDDVVEQVLVQMEMWTAGNDPKKVEQIKGLRNLFFPPLLFPILARDIGAIMNETPDVEAAKIKIRDYIRRGGRTWHLFWGDYGIKIFLRRLYDPNRKVSVEKLIETFINEVKLHDLRRHGVGD